MKRFNLINWIQIKTKYKEYGYFNYLVSALLIFATLLLLIIGTTIVIAARFLFEPINNDLTILGMILFLLGLVLHFISNLNFKKTRKNIVLLSKHGYERQIKIIKQIPVYEYCKEKKTYNFKDIMKTIKDKKIKKETKINGK